MTKVDFYQHERLGTCFLGYIFYDLVHFYTDEIFSGVGRAGSWFACLIFINKEEYSVHVLFGYYFEIKKLKSFILFLSK